MKFDANFNVKSTRTYLLLEMVYTELLIIKGIVLTREQILKVLPKDLNEDCDLYDEFYDHVIDGWEQNLKGQPGLRLFGFPRCSASAGELFILGYVAHTYYRRFEMCKFCEDHSVCDFCIGKTTGGYRNVDAIFEAPVEIKSERICRNCKSDQVESYETRAGETGRVCKLCNFVQSNVKEEGRYPSGYTQTLVKFLETLGMEITTNPGYFYMLDDCLSCT